MTLSLHITIQNPPPGLHYALQKGHGAKFELVQIQSSTGADLHFNWVIDLKGDKQKGSAPSFGGPFVQGPPSEKFLYINIGAYAGQQLHSGWRLKIPLRGITWEMAEASAGLETHIQGTAKNGRPNLCYGKALCRAGHQCILMKKEKPPKQRPKYQTIVPP